MRIRFFLLLFAGFGMAAPPLSADDPVPVQPSHLHPYNAVSSFYKRNRGEYILQTEDTETWTLFQKYLAVAPSTTLLLPSDTEPDFRRRAEIGGGTAMNATELKQLLDANPSVRIFFAGETHNSVADHSMQEQLIRDLSSRFAKVHVAFEMFPVFASDALSAWASGKISEREFLNQSGYYDSWGFDYRYYRKIFLTAKLGNISFYGINIPRRISSGIARQGLSALPQQDKELLAPAPWYANSEYEQHLQSFFSGMMGSHHGGNTAFFIQAQSAWDETMAWNLAKLYREIPADEVLVVIAGAGHFQKHAIPDRFAARAGENEYRVIETRREGPLDDPEDLRVWKIQLTETSLPEAYYSGLSVRGKEGAVFVLQAPPKGPLAALKHGDLVVSVNANAIREPSRLMTELSLPEGGDLEILIERNGEKQSIIITETERTGL